MMLATLTVNVDLAPTQTNQPVVGRVQYENYIRGAYLGEGDTYIFLKWRLEWSILDRHNVMPIS